MKTRVVVLGAGFGGLELSTTLSEVFGDDVDVTLIDKSDAFVFGYSKLDVMFGRTTLDAVRLNYRDIAKPGVRFLQQTITAVDPEARSVSSNSDSSSRICSGSVSNGQAQQPCLRVDGEDRLLQEAHARLRDVAIGQTNRVERRPAEHHVELRVAEDERVALVDQGHIDVPAGRLGQRRGELETAEARSQDHNPQHRAILLRLRSPRYGMGESPSRWSAAGCRPSR